MKSQFYYGKSGIEVTVPGPYRCHEITSRKASPLPDEQAAIDQALDHPIAAQPLVDLARGKKTAAISVCDITRPAPNRRTLPPILKRLHQAGIAAHDITILIATGLHRAATPEEIDIIVGPEIAADYRIVSHDARALNLHRYLGETRRGTPVYIEERFVAADLRITLGFIEQHLMLGFSGGRKLVAPGLAAQETIKVLHSPRFVREPLATEGSIAGNPLHDELLEIARMARQDFILDVTLTPNPNQIPNQDANTSRRISGVFAGDPVRAHAAGVQFLQRSCLEEIEEPADLVITSAAGFPLDLTLYQSVKGITAATHLARPGGRILLVAECAEGIGSPEFARGLATMTSFSRFLDNLRHVPVEVDQWQVEKLALAAVSHDLYLYTPGVPAKSLGPLANRAFATLEEATAAALRGLPADARILLVPEGPYTFARAAAPVA
jgi:nickel-dependent lactate racemase